MIQITNRRTVVRVNKGRKPAHFFLYFSSVEGVSRGALLTFGELLTKTTNNHNSCNLCYICQPKTTLWVIYKPSGLAWPLYKVIVLLVNNHSTVKMAPMALARPVRPKHHSVQRRQIKRSVRFDYHISPLIAMG